MGMFDETDGKWIKIYKIVAVARFLIIVVFGLIAGIGDSSANFLDIGIGGDDDGALDFLVWLLVCGFVGCIQVVIDMLIIQFLNNVQIIREKIEKM